MHRLISLVIGTLVAGYAYASLRRRKSPSATTASRRTACRSASRSSRAISGRGPEHHRAHLVGRRRHVAAQHAGGRRRAVRRSEPGRRRLARSSPAPTSKIVSDNVLTVAEFVWAVKPESPIKTLKDFKGKKIGYTNPRSTSQALALMLLQAGGYKESDAELVEDRRIRRGDRRARRGIDRRRGDHRAAVVEGQAQIPRRRRRERSAAAARQRRRRDDRRNGGEERRLHPRGDPRDGARRSSS